MTSSLSIDRLRKLLAPTAGPLPLQPVRIPAVLRGFDSIRAVVFDFYDTLVLADARPPAAGLATTAILPATFQHPLRAFGVTLPALATEVETALAGAIRAEHARRRAADPALVQPEVEIRDVWRDAFGLAGVPTAWIEEAVARWEAHTTRTRVSDGAALTLALLHSRGFLLGIGSNAQFLAPRLFELHFGRSPEAIGFHAGLCTWSFEVGVAKPDPRLFRLLAENATALGMRPREILFVGNDPARDIDPARAAGFATCLYAGDQRCLRPGTARPADATITHFEQLGGLL